MPMLGTQYRSAEVEFAKRSQENRDAAAATFGAELLAELLNRSLAVEEAYWLWWERHRIAKDATPGGLSEREILGLLDNVLRTFVQDCDEVRARGRRARLFAGNNDDGTVSTETLDDAESIERLGGFLASHEKGGAQ
jgi:hypothetical protein